MTNRAQFQREQTQGFICKHCHASVIVTPHIGTANRNHCNRCLWSRHVDKTKGDRQAACQAVMEPIGLTFKHEGVGKRGEIMLIHECESCQHISINRIARDDDERQILEVYEQSLTTTSPRSDLDSLSIYKANETDRSEVMTQLFGNPMK